MLICNNCSTVQEAGVDRCRQCQMPGQLIPWREATIPVAPAVPAHIHCPNCGCATPGEGEKCVECRFPLPTAQRPGRTGGEPGGGFRLRAG